MKKFYNLFAIIILVLVGGFIGITSANAENYKEYGLCVNGQRLSNEKTTINCGSGTATYDASVNTLTLNNATITEGCIEDDYASRYEAGIYYNESKPLKIVINNNNIIKSVKEKFDDGIISMGNITIINNGSLNITGIDTGIGAGKDGNKAIVLRGGNYQIESGIVSIYGYLKLENITGKIMAGTNQYGINAYPVSKTLLLKTTNKDENAYEFFKIGNFKTYKITKSANIKGYNYLPSEAYEGETIAVFEKDLKYYYKLKSIKIYKASNNSDVTNKVGYNSKKYTFIMPNYPVKVKIKMSDKNHETETIDFLKAKLTSYNSVKIRGKKTKIRCMGCRSGYYIYAKAGKSKKYKYLGKGKDVGYNRFNNIYIAKNLKPGKKYTFKIVWYMNAGYYGNFDIISKKSKKVTIRTLKKMNTPKVKKESKNEVLVKIKKIKGATGYKLAVSKNKDKGFKTIATIKSGKNSKVIKVKKNKKLYYRVRAYKKEGKTKVYGPWSKIKKYTLK